MSTPFIWGSAPRTPYDTTTPDQAIAEAIASHEDDPDAHLGAGQALESHRAAEIIDHRAESVVNDKLARSARRYAAIVDRASEYDFATIEAAVAYVYGLGGGDIFISRGYHRLTSDLRLPTTVGLYGAGVGESYILGVINTGSTLTFTDDVDRMNFWFSGAGLQDGRDYVTYTAAQAGDVNITVGYALFNESLEDFIGVITSVDTVSKRIYLDRPSPFTGAGWGVNASAAVAWTQGSNEVTVYTSNESWEKLWLEGTTLDDDYGGFSFTVIKKLAGKKAVVDRTHSGANIVRYVLMHESQPGTINIEGLTIGASISTVGIECENTNATVIIRDCEVNAFSKNLWSEGDLRIENSTIGMTTAAKWGTAKNMTCEDVVFGAYTTRTAQLEVGGRAIMRDCDISYGATPTTFPIYSVGLGSRFVRCRMGANAPWDYEIAIAGNYDIPLSLIDCVLRFGTAGGLNIEAQGAKIVGCRIYRNTNGVVQLSSASRRCIVANCMMTGGQVSGVVDAGTGNAITGNVSF